MHFARQKQDTAGQQPTHYITPRPSLEMTTDEPTSAAEDDTTTAAIQALHTRLDALERFYKTYIREISAILNPPPPPAGP